MRRKWIALIVMPLVVAVLAACPRKPPETVPDEVEVVTTPVPEPAPVEDVEPPPAEPVEDMVEEELPSDLVELNRFLAERGLVADVYFDYDQAMLSDESRDTLAQNAEWMREHPEYTFTVEGHADERGTNDYNLALGQERAASASAYLESLGVAGSRLRNISYGEERPVCTTSAESCWSQNRRVHFVVSGRQ
ncbi:MAG TPA: peptidoglycan-associated lipoprotein Pal [Thermoanaerobaculia bacterium]|nr:peptidoglycan-associated lipoprotein Pal [Thermoanaerobaculia bacterium]